MPSPARDAFLAGLSARFGSLTRLGTSKSLFEIGDSRARIYVRYSKLHPRQQMFYGLRTVELRQLEGHPAFIALVWDDQPAPLLLPYDEFEEVLRETKPASDGQIKAQVYVRDTGVELYVSKMGRFKVDAYLGWDALEREIKPQAGHTPALGHSQVQSLLGAIGVAKHFDVWIPPRDRLTLDWSVCAPFSCCDRLPDAGAAAAFVLREIDVVWLEPGSGRIKSAYEVEHSTTIYSGLLRLNDACLTLPGIESFGIVAQDARRSVFTRHMRRPTFQASGLDSLCSFLNYPDVYRWHERIAASTKGTLGVLANA